MGHPHDPGAGPDSCSILDIKGPRAIIIMMWSTMTKGKGWAREILKMSNLFEIVFVFLNHGEIVVSCLQSGHNFIFVAVYPYGPL